MEDIGKLKKEIRPSIASLPILCRLAEEEISDSIIEAVLEELVEVAVVGSEECAIKAMYLLTEKYRNVAEKRKEDVIRLIFEDTEKYKDDPWDGSWIYFLGFNFVLKLNWKELYVSYIRRFDEKLRVEFDEDYIRFYGLEQYVQKDV